jgi:hypothetical protein
MHCGTWGGDTTAMTLEQLRDTGLTPVQQILLSYLRSCAAVAELNARPPEWVFGSVYHLL